MNSNNTHATPAAALMREVLKPRPAPPPDVDVSAIKIEPGTAAEQVVYKAANLIRGLAIRNTRYVKAGEDFQAECFMTGFAVEHDPFQGLAARGDLVTAAAVQAVFERAMDGMRVLPTTREAKAEMKACAIAAGRAIRGHLQAERLAL